MEKWKSIFTSWYWIYTWSFNTYASGFLPLPGVQAWVFCNNYTLLNRGKFVNTLILTKFTFTLPFCLGIIWRQGVQTWNVFGKILSSPLLLFPVIKKNFRRKKNLKDDREIIKFSKGNKIYKPGNPTIPTTSPHFTPEWNLENSASSKSDLLQKQR